MYQNIGIFRKIPLRNTITRLDGSKSSNIAKVTNISVIDDNYKTYKEDGYECIQIGDSDRNVEGEQLYTISYTYDIGKDPLKDADELYYNLIGDEWDTSISNVTFKITMPKSFDQSLLGFSSGIKNSTDSSNVFYTVNENTISGYLANSLNAREALTVRLTLPEGYFVRTTSNVDMYPIIVIIISIAFVLISYFLWLRFGKDDEVIETVEFYPPDGYNSAEVGFLYEGVANDESVISLLIYLANNGYLRIEETEEQEIFGKSKSFKITKLKEYDGNNENERLFFNGLFDTKKSVTESDLYNSFYKTLNKIKRNINSKKNKNVIFESKTLGIGKWIIIMIIAILILITFKPIVEYAEREVLPTAILFLGVVFFMVLIMISQDSPLSIKLFILLWLLGFSGIFWMSMAFNWLIINPIYIISYIVGIICIVLLVIFYSIMPKRTQFGKKMLGKLRGFKRFLETAEKTQLEELVFQNPEYFYNILPYTYALGVSDVWVNQFETIAIQAPTWYDSSEDFNMHTFGNFMTKTMSSATKAMSSSPSSSGSGSGGGSSGGGSGGGGGGSW